MPHRHKVSIARPFALFSLAILATVAILYSPVWHGAPLWDDDAHLMRAELQPLGGLVRIWTDVGATQQYYPVTFTLFWLLNRLWGMNMLGYHLATIVLHATTAILLGRLLLRLEVPGAMLAAFVFAVHPVHVESVAWISEIKNTLSGVFALATCLSYIAFDRTRSRWIYAGTVLLFLLAVMSKTVTITLPLSLLVIAWWRHGDLQFRRDVAPLLPLLAVAIVFGIETAWFESRLLDTSGAEFRFSALERVLIAGRVWWFYLGKIVWPSSLMFWYPRWTIDTAAWWQYVFPLLAAAAYGVVWSWRKKAPGWLACALIFGITVGPTLGIASAYFFRFAFVADHIQYLPSIPVIAGIAALLTTAAQRLKIQTAPRTAIFAVLVAALSLCTYINARPYVDAESLYKETIRRNPDAWTAHLNLAVLRLDRTNPDVQAAIDGIKRSIAIEPANPRAHTSLGMAYERIGQLAAAEASYREALRLDPNFAPAHNNLGVVMQALGRPDEAVLHYRTAIRLNPTYAEPYRNLGQLMAEGGGPDAIDFLLKAVELDPTWAVARENLGRALFQKGRIQDAVAQYQEALRLQPKFPEAESNLGIAYEQMGRYGDAIAAYERALAVRPGVPLLLFNLGTAERLSGNAERAFDAYQQAVRGAGPNDAALVNEIGKAFTEMGKRDAANQAFARAAALRR